MYAHFYQLSEEPFNLTPDPKYQYINESTREALATVLHGIRSRKGFIALVGEAGTGKTTMLKRVLEEVEADTKVVFVFNPAVSFDELLEYICIELGVSTDGRGRLHLLERLNHFLLDQLTAGRNVVVMIDEAQTLDDSVLEELRLLTNLETAKEKILQIVLSGQPELDEKLRQPKLRQLRQRIGVRANLKAMRADEIDAYTQTRLSRAGSAQSNLFTAAALRKAWQAAEGIPRVTNVICDNAMMIAFAEGKSTISARMMSQAIRDLNGETFRDSIVNQVKGWLSAPVGRVAAVAVLAVFIGLPALWWKGTSPSAVDLHSPPVGEVALAPGDPTQQAVLATAQQPVVEPATEAAAQPIEPLGGIPAAVAGGQVRPEPIAALVPTSAPVPALPPQSPAPAAPDLASGAPSPTVAAPPAPTAAAADIDDVDSFPPPPSEVEPLDDLGGWPEVVPGAEPPTIPAPVGTVSVSGLSDVVVDSMRRAEVMGRATAARLYGDSDGSAAAAVVSSQSESVAEAATPLHSEGADQAASQVHPRSLEDARKLAAKVLGPEPPQPQEVAPLPEVPAKPIETASVVPPEQASIPSLAESVAKAPGRPIVGRFARVAQGDTLWAIALQYYGSVDSAVLTGILRYNAEIANPHQLVVGSYVFLPFLSAEAMVRRSDEGGYEVLLAESPDAATVDRARAWATAALPGRALRTVTRGTKNPVKILYAVGYGSHTSALDAAQAVLGRFVRGQGEGVG